MQDDYRFVRGMSRAIDDAYDYDTDLDELDWLRKNMLFKQARHGRTIDKLQLIMMDNY